ncbi:hypothetical protein CBL_20745, partial [Carabus blaptoides fortunei]
VETLFGRSLLPNMNYLTNSYKNVDLDDPNPGNSLVENTSARRKSRSCSSSLKDDKDCSSSSCSFSIHGPRELENDLEEMIPRVLEDVNGILHQISSTLAASLHFERRFCTHMLFDSRFVQSELFVIQHFALRLTFQERIWAVPRDCSLVVSRNKMSGSNMQKTVKCDGCSKLTHWSCVNLTADDDTRFTRSNSKSIRIYSNASLNIGVDSISKLKKIIADYQSQ